MSTYQGHSALANNKQTQSKPLTIILILLAFSLTACSQTSLQAPSISPKVFELAAINSKNLGLEIDSQGDHLSLGHQYLLVMIPFGTVRLQSPEQYLKRKAYQKLSIRGYRPILRAQNSIPVPKSLNLAFNDIQVSAYDFLFFRKIVAKVSLNATLADIEKTQSFEVQGDASYSSHAKYAFKIELENALNIALNEAIEDVLEQLRL